MDILAIDTKDEWGTIYDVAYAHDYYMIEDRYSPTGHYFRHKNGHLMEINGDDWTHVAYSSRHDRTPVEGTGANSLDEHLNKFHRRKARR